MMNATYSPEDNKLRLYSLTRLDTETYQRVRAAGFIWAPKQELFVAPMWTPGREDLLIELCGEIGDEDTSLVERAEGRAERFEEYSEHRAEDADRAHKAVKSITDYIPMGQPILIGHHSEKRARKDAERIENGMRRAVKAWETSKYWIMRAKGAIHAAKYKELPRVRVNRIKGLEADKKKQERNKANANKFLSLWGNPDKELTLERAKAIANHDWISRCFTLDKYPREEPISQYEGMTSLWSALDDGIINERQAAEIAIPSHIKSVAYADRWIRHLENRLLYEKAMLDKQGASDLLKPAPRAEQLPLCNYRAPEGFIMIENRYTRGEMIKYPQVDMTKAEYAKIYTDYKGTRTVENTHRVRIAIKAHEWFTVFITDSKIHVKPEPAENKARVVTQEPANPEADLRELWTSQGISEGRQNEIIADTTVKAQPGAQIGPWTIPAEDKDAQFRAMKNILKEGIKTVVAPQLFPTPLPLAESMVELAQIEPEKHWVLEPSAGTGNLLSALPENTSVLAIERNNYLAGELQRRFFHHYEGALRITVRNQDFLQFVAHEPDDIIPDAGFDRIIMNPPFENGVDIKHIRHALKKLNPGGRLVALCANGSRQREAFIEMAEYWEDLPAGSFKEQGTGVNVALMVITKEGLSYVS